MKTTRNRKPKYANHVIKELFSLDSACFLLKNDGNYVFQISDRYSPIAEGENPEAIVSIIFNTKRGYQLRIAVRGKFHLETPSYYTKHPNSWLEWGWIIFPQTEISRLRRFLARFIDENTQLWELMA